MNNTTGKLSFLEKLGYSVGDTASNLFFQTFILFLTYFYTDVFGISAGAVATIFLVGRIWDAVNDPLMGMIADRTNTRFGKFRPYLLYGALPFGILGFLMFITPNLSPTGKAVYAFITYNLMMMAYTVINVPYSALMGVITPNPDERTVVSSYRFVAAFAGLFIVQFSVLRLVRAFGGGNEQLGWQWAMTALAALAVVLFWVTFATTKERVTPPPGQKTPLLQDLSDLLRNRPWLLIGSATVFQLIFIVIRSSSIMYYFKYFVQNQQVTLLGRTYDLSFETLASTFMLSGTLVTVVGALVASKLSKMLGKPNCYYGGLGLAAICSALFYVLSPRDLALMFVLQLIASFAWGPVSVLQWAMYTDTADYSEWKTGRRATGLIMAASLFALKLGIALGGALMAWLLDFHGFKPNVEQTTAGLLGIKLLMSIYPAVAGAMGCVLMLFYPLNNKMLVQIAQDLLARRQQNSE